MQATTNRHKVHFSSVTDRWKTPDDFYRILDDEFSFDSDPCPLDADEDALASLFFDWSKKRVFCNPPYGRLIEKFLLRGLECQLAVFLLPARTDVKWFHDIVLPNATEIRFIRRRLKFGTENKEAPFPSMVVVFRKDK